MTQQNDLMFLANKRRKLNSSFSVHQVQLSDEASKEQHSEITGIDSNGDWSASIPGGGTVNRVRSHTNSAHSIGKPVHTSINTGESSVDAKPTAQAIGFSNPAADDSISADIPSDFVAKAIQP